MIGPTSRSVNLIGAPVTASPDSGEAVAQLVGRHGSDLDNPILLGTAHREVVDYLLVEPDNETSAVEHREGVASATPDPRTSAASDPPWTVSVP